MTTANALYNFLRGLAEAGKPMPDVGTICDVLGVGQAFYRAAMKELMAADRLRLQRRTGQCTEARRVMFPDGVATVWTVPPKGNLMTYSSVRTRNETERRPVTAEERAMIDAAVAAGKVRRVASSHRKFKDDFYRKVQAGL